MGRILDIIRKELLQCVRKLFYLGLQCQFVQGWPYDLFGYLNRSHVLILDLAVYIEKRGVLLYIKKSGFLIGRIADADRVCSVDRIDIVLVQNLRGEPLRGSDAKKSKELR